MVKLTIFCLSRSSLSFLSLQTSCLSWSASVLGAAASPRAPASADDIDSRPVSLSTYTTPGIIKFNVSLFYFIPIIVLSGCLFPIQYNGMPIPNIRNINIEH